MARNLFLSFLGTNDYVECNYHPEGRLERSVGLSPEQRDAVRGLMAEQRQKTQAVREDTDGKIRALLTAEQQKKYDAFRAQNKAKKTQ